MGFAAIADSQETVMAGDELLGELPAQARPPADEASRGAPRLREPRRDQIALPAVDIESLIGEDHPASAIWAYVASPRQRIKCKPATQPRKLTDGLTHFTPTLQCALASRSRGAAPVPNLATPKTSQAVRMTEMSRHPL